MRKLYQPIMVATGDVPDYIYDHQVFLTKEDAELYMQSLGTLPNEYKIEEYDEDDIEDYVVLNKDGEVIALQSEMDLDDSYNTMLEKVKNYLAKTGEQIIKFKAPVQLYSSLSSLYGISGKKAAETFFVLGTTEKAICTEDFIIPFEDLQDVDDFGLISSAIDALG